MKKIHESPTWMIQRIAYLRTLLSLGENLRDDEQHWMPAVEREIQMLRLHLQAVPAYAAAATVLMFGNDEKGQVAFVQVTEASVSQMEAFGWQRANVDERLRVGQAGRPTPR